MNIGRTSSKQVRRFLFTILTVAAALALVPLTGALAAGSRDVIAIQGRLSTATSTPVADGTYPFCFRLYDSETNGSLLFTEKHEAVTVTNGLYAVKLGSESAAGILNSVLVQSNPLDLYMSVAVGTASSPSAVCTLSDTLELAPRIQLAASAFAFRAKSADSVNTTTGTVNAAGATFSGNVGIGTTGSTGNLVVAGQISANTLVGNGSGLTGISTGPWQGASPGPIYYNGGNVGIGTTSPTARLQLIPSGDDPVIDVRQSNNTAYGYSFGVATANSGLHIKGIEDGVPFTLMSMYNYSGPASTKGVISIPGNVGIGTTSPKSALDVAGGIKVGTMSVCDAGTAGSIRYNAASYALEFCDGKNWFLVKQGLGPFTCGTSNVYDIDGNTYNTVLIGAQCWMRENMRTTKYPNGNSITKGTTWSSTDVGYYSCPPNSLDPATGEDCDAAGGTEKLGMLYQWSAIMNGSTSEGAQGICPTGWHIPTDAQYKTLEVSLGMCTGTATSSPWCVDNQDQWRGTDQGTQLKSGGSSGFSGLLAGFRNIDSSYYNRGSHTYIWSSTQAGSTPAWVRDLDVSFATVHRSPVIKAYGLSARCVKD